MSLQWGDLNARARGLATHLLDRAALEGLARAPDAAALAEALRASGFPVPDGGGGATPPALDLAVRRATAARLRLLAWWCGARVAPLTVIFEDEDRRSLRALLRGTVQGAAPELRLSGVIPTPSFPERALQELARQTTPGAVAALLVTWRHPYGPALLPEAAGAHPDLLRLEHLLNRCFAARALAAAPRGPLADFVRDTIDLENGLAAIVVAGQGREAAPDEAFLAGGRALTRAAFRRAAAAADAPGAARRVAETMGAPFRRFADDPGAIEAAVLRQRIRALTRAARLEPLGPAPLLAYVLRLRGEVLDLRRLIWGTALGAPEAALMLELVTV